VKNILLIVLTGLTVSVQAQPWSLELFGGISNYQGDLNETRYTFKDSKAAFGIGAGYTFTDHLTFRGMFYYSNLNADDKNNTDPLLISRNLNFSTRIYELGLMAQYHIFSTDNARINPYLVAGVSLFRFNPYTYDTLGTKYYLRPLSTEGQGLADYPDKDPYSLTQFALPFGAGIKFKVSENISIGWEVVLRKTFTDYLDDLSKTYADRDVLLAAKGAKAVELAYRSGELKNGNPVYPDAGTVRGSSKYKDWYYFSGITASFTIPDQTNQGRLKGSKTGCPSSVY
jgi:opacity protein-like surface antigen